MSAPLVLLLDAALRASVLGMMVALLLKLAKLRDARTEIPVWTAVLLAALAMPLLRTRLPAWLALPLPHIGLVPAAAEGHGLAPAAAPAITLLGSSHGVALVNAGAASLTGQDWLFHHGMQLVLPLYALAVTIQLARLATGLALTVRLYRSAMPIAAPWAEGRAIRASAAVAGPISFSRCILLPADYADWPHNKLLAVLAHEQSHVRHGDFFIQLLANLYRSVFWFSPFAWWLQARLCALAEAASDEAAIQCLNDRASYAEILVEVSRRAHGLPIQVAMAKGPDIHWRIDRILGERRERRLGAVARLGAVGAILPAAMIVAGAHAAVPPAGTHLPRFTPLPLSEPLVIAGGDPAPAAPLPRPATPVHASKATRVAESEPDVTYNPRALLNAPEVAVIPALVPLSDGRHRNSRDNAAIILGNSVYVPNN